MMTKNKEFTPGLELAGKKDVTRDKEKEQHKFPNLNMGKGERRYYHPLKKKKL